MSTVPRITSPYVIYSDFTKADLPSSFGTPVEVVNIQEFGILYSMALVFNNRNVRIIVEIDGTQVYDIDVENIYDMLSQSDTPTSTSMVFGFEDSKDLFTFKPTSPVMFRNSLVVKAIANGSSSSRDFNGAVIEYTRE